MAAGKKKATKKKAPAKPIVEAVEEVIEEVEAEDEDIVVVAPPKKVEKEATPVVGDVINRQILNDMGHEGLVLFARLQYGIDGVTTKTHAREELVEMVMNYARKYSGNAEMKVLKRGEEGAEVPPGYVKVRVQAGKYNPNMRPIPVGLNFKMATIPVNKDVIMPAKYLVCLEDAVRTEYFVDRSDPNNETLGWQESHSYPYSVLERG